MDTPAEPTFIPFFMLLAFFLFVYFVTIRPQMTSSGLVGRVETVSDRFVSIKLNDSVSVNMQKEFISSQLPKGTINSIETQ